MNLSQKNILISLDGKPQANSFNPEDLKGIIPPLITPLTEEGLLDHEGLHRLIEHVLAGGVHGLFVLGTSGEAAALSLELRREVAIETCRQVNQRVPVLLGVTDASLANVLDLTASAADLGANAIVVSAPYYFRPEQKELVRFFRRVASESTVPVYLYNMPELTKTPLEVDTVRRLMDVPNIVGLKDSSGDPEYLAAIHDVAQARPDWSLFVGCESLLAESVTNGIHGGVTGGANVWPELFVELYDAALRGDNQRCQTLQIHLLKLNEIYQFGGYGVGVIRGLKCALDLIGICGDKMAEPLAECNQAQRNFIEQQLMELHRLPKQFSSPNRGIPTPHFKTPAKDPSAMTDVVSSEP